MWGIVREPEMLSSYSRKVLQEDLVSRALTRL